MKIMVSACLLGDNVKYNGGNNKNDELIAFLKDYEVIKVCPEIFGGLSTPRDPSEIINNKVFTINRVDITNEFMEGARKTLKIAKENDVKIAILKKNSPSCGSNSIYDGTFSHNIVEGNGITAKLLKENGIIVFDEENYKNIKKIIL